MPQRKLKHGRVENALGGDYGFILDSHEFPEMTNELRGEDSKPCIYVEELSRRRTSKKKRS